MSNQLYRSLNKTGAQAACAGINSAGSAVHDSLYLLYIRLIGSVAASVRVRNLDSESYTLAADFTFCHSEHLPLYNRILNYSVTNNIVTENA